MPRRADAPESWDAELTRHPRRIGIQPPAFAELTAHLGNFREWVRRVRTKSSEIGPQHLRLFKPRRQRQECRMRAITLELEGMGGNGLRYPARINRAGAGEAASVPSLQDCQNSFTNLWYAASPRGHLPRERATASSVIGTRQAPWPGRMSDRTTRTVASSR